METKYLVNREFFVNVLWTHGERTLNTLWTLCDLTVSQRWAIVNGKCELMIKEERKTMSGERKVNGRWVNNEQTQSFKRRASIKCPPKGFFKSLHHILKYR